jgi:1-pyrroline-5-carboxylate dehydrogenase
MPAPFKLTYSTMFDPPEALHERFEAALAQVRARCGQSHPHYINGQDVPAAVLRDKYSPIQRDQLLGRFPDGTASDVDRAMRAASTAFEQWRRTPPAERHRLLRAVAAKIEERVYEIGAALALEVGKNRMEALGETQETADFFTHYCADFERQGFDHRFPTIRSPATRATTVR